MHLAARAARWYHWFSAPARCMLCFKPVSVYGKHIVPGILVHRRCLKGWRMWLEMISGSREEA